MLLQIGIAEQYSALPNALYPNGKLLTSGLQYQQVAFTNRPRANQYLVGAQANCPYCQFLDRFFECRYVDGQRNSLVRHTRFYWCDRCSRGLFRDRYGIFERSANDDSERIRRTMVS